jgi:predicted AAA+ superfamily ATPase
MWIERDRFIARIEAGFAVNPVVALLGPRQCGKTSLAKAFAKGRESISFDLEDPRDLDRLDNPMLALEGTEGLVVVDEIQRRPELFPVLRVLVDRSERARKFLVLGSASRDLIGQGSESLAGRVSFIELTPFSGREVDDLTRVWLRGGLPPSYLAESDEVSYQWRSSYVQTFLERDLPNLGISIPARNIRRFWMMLAHYHGQVFNSSEIAASLSLSDKTVRRYLDLLTDTLMVRQLSPWVENLKKRQVKRSKVYIRDSGLVHSLLQLSSRTDVERHPKLGASWEGFAVEEVIRALEAGPEDVYFWAVHAQSELDLLVFHEGRRLGFEVKYQDSPKKTRSMGMALELLGLDGLTVIYPGDQTFPIDESVHAQGLGHFLTHGPL